MKGVGEIRSVVSVLFILKQDKPQNEVDDIAQNTVVSAAVIFISWD